MRVRLVFRGRIAQRPDRANNKNATFRQREAGAYDVTADGKKFLINSGNLKEGTEPFTLVQNWTAELKK